MTISENSGILAGLFFAFLGGIILNLMPCVFPILSLKIFSFLRETDRRKIRRSAWEYALGVLASFFFVGAVLTALRLSGEAVGWGYHLQSPLMVYALSLLFFLIHYKADEPLSQPVIMLG